MVRRRPAAEVIADAFAEADRRDPQHARPWIAVIDGNCHQIETVTRLAAERGVTVKILIDLIHVEYLWKAANSFFYPGDPGARAWWPRCRPRRACGRPSLPRRAGVAGQMDGLGAGSGPPR